MLYLCNVGLRKRDRKETTPRPYGKRLSMTLKTSARTKRKVGWSERRKTQPSEGTRKRTKKEVKQNINKKSIRKWETRIIVLRRFSYM